MPPPEHGKRLERLAKGKQPFCLNSVQENILFDLHFLIYIDSYCLPKAFSLEVHKTVKHFLGTR